MDSDKEPEKKICTMNTMQFESVVRYGFRLDLPLMHVFWPSDLSHSTILAWQETAIDFYPSNWSSRTHSLTHAPANPRTANTNYIISTHNLELKLVN